MSYELFNFSDPLEEACENAINAVLPADIRVIMPRSDDAAGDVSVAIRFADGAATGHKQKTPYDEWIYDLYAGGVIEIEVRQVRYAVNAPSDDEAGDTTARDTLGLLAGKIRYALRRTDAKPLNDLLDSPKISHIQPQPSSRYVDDELAQDVCILRYSINYAIPADIWPKVILTEAGYVLKAEDGTELVAE